MSFCTGSEKALVKQEVSIFCYNLMLISQNEMEF